MKRQTVYPKLFSPIQLGNMTVKNRIFMSAMSTALCSMENEVTDEALAYYIARARGGAGFLTTENVMVDENSHYNIPNNMGLYRDEQIPGMQRLADAVHQFGAKVGVQLLHGGPAATSTLNGGRIPIAASAIPLRSVGEIPRAMTVEEIHCLTEKFVQAAIRAQEAGIDAVEVHAAHRHGVLGTFLSPLSNKRVDEYGGSVEGRMRFLLEVVSGIRKALGPDYPIIVRMSMTEAEPGGQSMLDAIYIAQCLEQAGVNLLNLSNGTLETFWKTVTPNGTPRGVNTELSKQLKETVTIPVGVIGRNCEPWAAEQVLALGRTDVVYMGRALLCDPDFPNKAQEGRTADIRPCIGCTDCITHVHGRQIRCTMNPYAGKETQYPAKADNSKKILVIGGGPSGLQAAATAAQRGHRVTLLEESDHLGGQMFLAGIPISKQDIAQGTKYLIHTARQAGVELRFNAHTDEQTLRAEHPDAVIMATGSSPIMPGFLKGARQLVSAWDVLAGKVATGQNIVVVGGGAVGCETAEFLVHPQNDRSLRGKRVTVIEMADNLMKDDRSYARSLLVRRMQEKGCTILVNAKVEDVKDDELVYSQQGKLITLKGVDTVICALGSRPNSGAVELAALLGVPVYSVGDTLKIGRIYEAITSGEAAGAQL